MGREGRISGGKPVSVALINTVSERRREDVAQRGASWSTDETPWRWQARAEALAGQWRIAWLKVSGSSPHRGPSGESSALNQEGWAAR